MKTKELVAYQNLIEIDLENMPKDVNGEHDEFFRDEYEVELDRVATKLTYWEWVVERVEVRDCYYEENQIVMLKDAKNGLYGDKVDISN